MDKFTKAEFIQQVAEYEGVDIEIDGYDDAEFRKYNGASNTGKLMSPARVTTLLEKRLTLWKINPKAVTITMPGGSKVTGDVLIAAQSDLRMGALRDMRVRKLQERNETLYGYKVWMSPELEQILGGNAIKVTGFYVFDKSVITTTDHPAQGNVFSEVNDMRKLWLVIEAIKHQMVKDDIIANLTGDVFRCDGVCYQRYVPVQFGE